MANKNLRVIVLSLVVVIVVSFLPQLLDTYYLHVFNIALISIILAVGINFILGFGGQISMAQAAFFGIGAYSYSILSLHHVPLLAAAICAIALTAIVGFAIGWPALKLKGHYLALATLGFGVIMEQLMTNLTITGGANGLTGIPKFSLGSFQFESDNSIFYLLLIFSAGTMLISELFNRSPLGMRSRALRDDETAASVVGVNVSSMKLLLFTVSAAFAGLAGVLYSGLLGYISPDVFAWSTTFNYLVMVVVGGLGSTVGAAIGAILFTFIPEWLRFLKESYMAVFGLVVILMMMGAPEGLMGLLRLMASHSIWRQISKARFERHFEKSEGEGMN